MGQTKKVEFYGLTTCGWCKKAKGWLDDHMVECEVVYMNELSGSDLDEAKERVLSFVSRLSFPLVIINDGDEIIQGFKPDKFEDLLG